MGKERNKDFAERHREQPTLEPQTLVQHFKEGAINMAEDCRGTWLRLTMYTGAFTGIGVALERSGVNFETAVILTAGIMIPTMAAGELYLMDRLAERLPWLSVHHTSFRKRW